MELFSIKLARAIWLFPIRDLNPRGLTIGGDSSVYQKLTERYQFDDPSHTPKEDKSVEKMEFKNGRFFDAASGADVNVDLSLYEDGIIGDTRMSTDVSDSFLDDLLDWVSNEFNLIKPPYIKKTYLSELYVSCSSGLESMSDELRTFSSELSRVIGDEMGRDVEPCGIQFAFQPRSALQTTQVFKFERSLEAPHIPGRFYTYLVSTTKNHMELLNKFEKLLA